MLEVRREYEEQTSNNIQTLFPSTVIQQIHNTLAVRQVLPKKVDEFELVFNFFGYADDDPELQAIRLKQANLAGPAGYISMEDTEATELVQRAVESAPAGAASYMGLGDEARDRQSSLITEHLIRSFWSGYRRMMGWS
jgi:anthranilate 1,2-dioxygenase large subunit